MATFTQFRKSYHHFKSHVGNSTLSSALHCSRAQHSRQLNSWILLCETSNHSKFTWHSGRCSLLFCVYAMIITLMEEQRGFQEWLLIDVAQISIVNFPLFCVHLNICSFLQAPDPPSLKTLRNNMEQFCSSLAPIFHTQS